ncbi:MAG: hemolysin family protein [Cellvibrionaceae bacterium]
MDVFILAGLILLNGVFAMSEIALIAARRPRLAQLADDGDASAGLAVRLGEEPTQFLSTIQIGITAIGILNGIVGEAALAQPFAAWLHDLGIDRRASSVGATFLIVALITYFTIVVGELVPKRIAQLNPEGIARRMARPISLLATLSRPFVYLLSASTDGLLRMMGKGEVTSANVTEEDIYAMLAHGSATGVIEREEHDIVRNVFRLDDRQLGSLMTPRSAIVFLDLDQPLEERLNQLVDSDHSRFPVCRGGLETILGVITAKRLLKRALKEDTSDPEQQVQPAVFVPESLTGIKLLEQFRESGVQMVFVTDEYGQLQGLITLQDVLEALAGEFTPKDPDDLWAVRREDGSWLLDGLTPIPELKDRLELKTVPEEEKGRYHTLSGMMMWLIDRLPKTGDTAAWDQWRFEVVDLDGNRVDKVLASHLEKPDDRERGDQEPGDESDAGSNQSPEETS